MDQDDFPDEDEFAAARAKQQSSRLIEAPDYFDEEVCEGKRELGVRDPDLEPGDEFALAPMYHIIEDSYLDVSAQETLGMLAARGPGSGDSPRHLMLSSKYMIECNARAMYRMDARGLLDEFVPGCIFPVGDELAAGALHLSKDEKGNVLTRWRAALVNSFRPAMFNLSTTLTAYLEMMLNLPVDSSVKNEDPVLNETYTKGTGEEYLEHADIGFWKITKQIKFKHPKSSMVHKFPLFWLPCSLEVESQFPRTAPCAMVHYPCFQTVRGVLERGNKDEVSKLLRSYSFLMKDEYLRAVQSKASESQVDEETVKRGSDYRAFRKQVAEQLLLKIESALKACFCGFVDGDCMVSLGRVQEYNSSMVAVGLSSLPGSSGAPIFLLKPGLELMFFAVLNGPPNKSANYNLATSTDNPTFALQYMTTALDGLPPPSSQHWLGEQQQQLRLHAFERWLSKHCHTLKSVATSRNQLRWLAHVEELDSLRRRV